MRGREDGRRSGWTDGMRSPDDIAHIARILSGQIGTPKPYCREWREPDWPIYRIAVSGPVAGFPR